MNENHPGADQSSGSLEQFKAWLDRQSTASTTGESRVRCRVGVRRLIEAILDENEKSFSITEADSLARSFLQGGGTLVPPGLKGRLASVLVAAVEFKVPRNFVAVEEG